jgi:Fur family ferric uptake transcriptional regulator
MSHLQSTAMSQLERDLKQKARGNGFRLTPQRQLVLDAVAACAGHCTPDQVHERVRATTPFISRATVYRALEFLLGLEFVTVAQIKDNVTVYELARKTPHHHLMCQHCNQIYEVPHTQVEPFFAHLHQVYGFTIRTDHLVLFGVCEECRTSRNENVVISNDVY